jgi:predicted phosphodiesterase
MEDGDRRIIIISDTHLGTRGAPTPEALRPLWAGADELIVNGDLAQLHDPACRTVAARQVMRLQDLCEADGVTLTVLSGNHDPQLTDVRHLVLRDGLIFITHGDVLHPAISPWNGTDTPLHALNEEALAALDRPQRSALPGQLAAAQHAAHLNWDEPADAEGRPGLPARLREKARKAAATLWYWRTLPRRAAAFARRYAPDARFFIFGHIHRAGIWRFGDLTVINTGCWHFPFRPLVVRIERGRLSVWPVRWAGAGACGLRARPLAQYTLPAASPAHRAAA